MTWMCADCGHKAKEPYHDRWTGQAKCPKCGSKLGYEM